MFAYPSLEIAPLTTHSLITNKINVDLEYKSLYTQAAIILSRTRIIDNLAKSNGCEIPIPYHPKLQSEILDHADILAKSNGLKYPINRHYRNLSLELKGKINYGSHEK
jgi:hypothetical protein